METKRLLIRFFLAQIKILNESEDEPTTSSGQDCEKADLESCEKEILEINLSLPLPTTSANVSNIVQKSSPTTPHKLPPCNYKQEIEKLRNMLYVPGQFLELKLGNYSCE